MKKYLLDFLMKNVERYNEMVEEDERLDWHNDVLDNIKDTNDEDEIREMYSEIESLIIVKKMIKRMKAGLS